MTRRARVALARACSLAAASLLLATAGCGVGDDTALDVFAAASLTTPFTRLAAEFERAHPDIDVRLQFAGSAALAAQIVQGAPADVFAAADEPTMQVVVDAGNADGHPVVFAHNRLAIAVHPGNPARVATLADLAAPGVDVALCAPPVPCGRYARAALERAGVAVTPVTHTESVTAAVTLVALGEVDAAVVYATDVRTRPEVDGVAIDDAHQVPVVLPTVAVRGSDRELARRWIDFVTGPRGRAVLVDELGFLAP